MWRILLISLCALPLAALDGGVVEVTPTTLDAGGVPAASDDYLQFAAGLGDAVVATGVEAQSYSGRDAYVGQLPEPAVLSLVQDRHIVQRGDAPLVVAITRVGDEDDPIAVGFSLIAAHDPPSAGLTPDQGIVDLTGATQADLTLTIGDGRPANVLLRLQDPTGEAVIGTPGEALISILAAPSAPTAEPVITSVPALATAQGETWTYDVVIDPGSLGLPHALRPTVDLEFILLDAPAGATIVKTGALRARVTWPEVSGADEHRLIRLRVHDHVSAYSEVQEVLLHVRAQPSGNG